MKKLLVAVLCMALLLAGCNGGNASEASSSEASTEAEIQVESEESSQDTSNVSENLYESDTLLTKNAADVEYQIPSTWDSGSNESDNVTYYYDDGMMVMVQLQSVEYDSYDDVVTPENEESIKNSTLDGIKNGAESYEEISSETIEILGLTGFRYVANAKISGIEWFMDSVLFVYNRNLYVFGMLVDLDSGLDYSLEFASLLDSIVVVESQNDGIEGIYADLKSSMDEVVRDLGYSGAMTALIMGEFKETFEFVSNMDSFSDAGDGEEFTKFLRAISYFEVFYDEGTVGKEVGERGWDAIRSLMLMDGEFHAKMEELKSLYESTGNTLSDTSYEAGQYKIGQDMPSGEYVIFSNSGSGYFAVTSDSNGDDIIANENFDYNSIITVKDGEYLELSRCYAVPISEVNTLPLDSANMLKLGLHISAEEYKLIADSDRAYYCIYNDGRQNDIESNDNFSGQAYVTIEDGQYLLLSRCHIEQ